MTILTAGFVESEMTKGKAIQRDGEVAVDEEARDVSCNTASSNVSVKNTASPTSGIVIYGPPNCFTDEQINRNSSPIRLQVQIGVFPVARVDKLCKAALNGIRRGDWYVTWPSLYLTLPLIACLAPEVLTWQSYALYNAKKGSPPLSQRMLDATGAKRFYPPSLRSHPGIKTEKTGDRREEDDAASNV